MTIKDLVSKLFKKTGAGKAGDMGLNMIIETLQKLAATAEAGDKINVNNIIAIVRKALSNKQDLSKIAKQCIEIAAKISNGGLRETITKLFK